MFLDHVLFFDHFFFTQNFFGTISFDRVVQSVWTIAEASRLTPYGDQYQNRQTCPTSHSPNTRRFLQGLQTLEVSNIEIRQTFLTQYALNTRHSLKWRALAMETSSTRTNPKNTEPSFSIWMVRLVLGVSARSHLTSFADSQGRSHRCRYSSTTTCIVVALDHG